MGYGLEYPFKALERVQDTEQPCRLHYRISVAPVDERHSVNRARWVKLVILLYRFCIEAGRIYRGSYPHDGRSESGKFRYGLRGRPPSMTLSGDCPISTYTSY